MLMQRPEYQKVFAISQSAMKAFKTKPLQEFYELYINQKDDDTDDQKFAFGSLVDTLAFTPELLEERFFIPEYEVTIPGEKVKKIVDNVYREAREVVANKELLNEKGNLPEPMYIPNLTDLYEWQELVFKYAKEIEYGGKTWSRSRIMDTVAEDGQVYFRMLSECNGRMIITAQDNADAMEIVENLRKNEDTAKYFVPQDEASLLFQQEIFVDYKYGDNLTIPLKAALDIIRLDHKNQTVVVPDLKTTHTSEFFAKIARDFGYIIQVSFYMFILKEWLKTYEDGKYAHYKFELPVNIVIDRKYKIPFIYEYTWDDLDIARNGSEEKNVEGWQSILERIAWHIANSVWDKPKELYETGKIKLKIF